MEILVLSQRLGSLQRYFWNLRRCSKIYLDLYPTIHGMTGLRSVLKKRNKNSKLIDMNEKLETVFSDRFDGIVTWHIVDLQKDTSGNHSVEVLEKISSYIFGIDRPEDRRDLTFIVIDEA